MLFWHFGAPLALVLVLKGPFLARLDEVQEELLYYPGVGVGCSVGVSKMLKFYVKVFYVMGKALSGELFCPFDRSCFIFHKEPKYVKHIHYFRIPWAPCFFLIMTSGKQIAPWSPIGSVLVRYT